MLGFKFKQKHCCKNLNLWQKKFPRKRRNGDKHETHGDPKSIKITKSSYNSTKWKKKCNRTINIVVDWYNAVSHSKK